MDTQMDLRFQSCRNKFLFSTQHSTELFVFVFVETFSESVPKKRMLLLSLVSILNRKSCSFPGSRGHREAPSKAILHCGCGCFFSVLGDSEDHTTFLYTCFSNSHSDRRVKCWYLYITSMPFHVVLYSASTRKATPPPIPHGNRQ